MDGRQTDRDTHTTQTPTHRQTLDPNSRVKVKVASEIYRKIYDSFINLTLLTRECTQFNIKDCYG